jgi:hypothetical protein
MNELHLYLPQDENEEISKKKEICRNGRKRK